MSKPIIEIRELSKSYRLGTIGMTSLREEFERLLATTAARWRKRPRRTEVEVSPPPLERPPSGETFWALRDVSFNVAPGEVVGIIGRNGAGKSTLLKILSRITQQTAGEITLRGRIASLLEVGTGFHPELSGRENIFLNGAMLGMRREEIRQKFDAIADFSGVEKFLDTPVKRYSSGMYVRLAFAVAAHLEPEILVVDEVLAVGDVAFQKKCLGKMGEVARAGRTVLLVSHNLASIAQLCPTCVWLDEGRVRRIGATPTVVAEYVRTFDASGGRAEAVFAERSSQEAQVRRARLTNQHGVTCQSFECDEPVILEFLFQVHRRIPGLYGYLSVDKHDSTPVMMTDSFDTPPNPMDDLAEGFHLVRIAIPPRSLAPGEYQVYLNFTSNRAQSWDVDSPGVVARFSLTDSTSRRGNNRPGYFSTLLQWEVEAVRDPDCIEPQTELSRYVHRK